MKTRVQKSQKIDKQLGLLGECKSLKLQKKEGNKIYKSVLWTIIEQKLNNLDGIKR